MANGIWRDLPKLSGQRIAVTGAGGFIGARIVAALVQAGAQPVALLRAGHDAARLRGMGAEVRLAPLASDARLFAALDGVQAVVHAAYDMRAGQQQNMAAFDGLLAAMHSARVRRIVHLSSVVVYDDWPDGRLNESSPITTSTGGAYRQAKMAMENRLLTENLEAAILQPTLVYGPGSALWTAAPMAALRSGGVILPDPAGRCAAVYVDDVAAAAVRAAAVAGLGRERFLISGPDRPGWGAFYEGYRALVGQGTIEYRPLAQLWEALGPEPEEPPRDAPSAAARVSAAGRRLIGSRRFDWLVSRVRALGLHPARGPALPDRHMLALLAASPEVSTAKANEHLGHVPQVDFAHGLNLVQQANC